MTIYYYAQGGTAVKGIAHNPTEVVDPVEAYGTGTYVIVDNYNPPPIWDDNLPGYDYPTVTDPMQADSARYECQYRIWKKIDAVTQSNVNAYVADLAAAAANGTAMSAPQIADCATAKAIHQWIGRTSGAGAAGMLQACDNLIAAHDPQWYLDGKWPAWNSAWDAFVARF